MQKKPTILGYPNYSRLYFAGLTSELGSFITETVLMMFVFEIGHQNKSLLGLIRTVFLLSLFVGGIFGGPIGERYDRRKVLIWCESLRVPIVLSLIFYQEIWWIIAANGAIAFFTGIFKPSRQALVNDVVPPHDMRKANSLFGSTYAILHMAGPLIGASLYASLKGINEVMIFDFLTYILGITLLFKINYKQPASLKREGRINILKESAEGFRYVKKRWDLISIYLHSIINGLCIGILIPLLLPFITEVMGKSEREYGYLMALFGIGGVVGGIISEKLSHKFHLGKIIVIMACLEPVMMNIWVKFPHYQISLVIFLVWGIIVFTRITGQMNYLSATVETGYLTRCHSLLEMSFVTPSILAGLLVSIFGNSIKVMEFMEYAAYAYALAVFPRLFFKEMKTLMKSSIKQVEREEIIID